MKKSGLLILSFVFCFVSFGQAATVYTDYNSYMTALGSASTIQEGFEDSSVWPRHPSLAKSVVSQGLNWSVFPVPLDRLGGLADGITTNTGFANSGTYGVFHSLNGGILRDITVSSSTSLYGVGGYFDSSHQSPYTLTMTLDGADEFYLDFSGATNTSSETKFWGLIDDAGFNDFRMKALATWGADDFTFATEVPTVGAAVPEPSTIILLGSGLVGLVWYGRKRKKV